MLRNLAPKRQCHYWGARRFPISASRLEEDKSPPELKPVGEPISRPNEPDLPQKSLANAAKAIGLY